MKKLVSVVLLLGLYCVSCINPLSLFDKKKKEEALVEKIQQESNQQENHQTPPPFVHPKTQAVRDILNNLLNKEGTALDSELDRIANVSAGIRRNISQNIENGLFIAHAGLENTIDLTASEDSIVLIFYGNENTYTIHANPGTHVWVVHYFGTANKIFGADKVLTHQDFLKN